MTIARPYASSARLAFFALIAAMGSSGAALARNSWRPHSAVVCTSEANGPWILKARGTLTRTKSKNELLYEFKSSEHVFDWRFVTSPEGNTTALGPGLLMGRFIAPPKQPQQSTDTPRGPINAAQSSDLGPRRQSLEATGEIREWAAKDALVLLIGSKCPNARPALQPNGAVERDALHAPLRASYGAPHRERLGVFDARREYA